MLYSTDSVGVILTKHRIVEGLERVDLLLSTIKKCLNDKTKI